MCVCVCACACVGVGVGVGEDAVRESVAVKVVSEVAGEKETLASLSLLGCCC